MGRVSVRYRFRRMRAKLRRSGNRKPKMEGFVEKAVEIVIELIRNPKSELLVAPISGRQYIHDKQRGIFVTLHGGTLTIINSVYQYDILLTDKEKGYVVGCFNRALEKRRLRLEGKIKSKVNRSLDNILDDISPKNNQ